LIYDARSSFFELFDRKPESYKVITKCSDLLKEISQSSYAFNSQIEEELPPEILVLDKSNYLGSKRNNEAFFVSNNVVALDPVTAKLDAEIHHQGAEENKPYIKERPHRYPENAEERNAKRQEGQPRADPRLGATPHGRTSSPGRAYG
jgi:hypothetical protein